MDTPAQRPTPLVKCPTCAVTLAYSLGNPYRPFCSERCQSIDFGAWSTESYRVAQPDEAGEHSDTSTNPQDP